MFEPLSVVAIQLDMLAAYQKGKPTLVTACLAHVPGETEVKAIRKKHWEHGRRGPSGAARAFLTVIAKEPAAVRRALLG